MGPSDADEENWFRPVWEDTEDEEAPPLPRRSLAHPKPPPRPAGPDLASLLAPLASAQDTLARLDARAEVAPEPVRAGLIARLAFREAAGWLATLGCWVHPRDLALRAAHLIGLGELPNTPGRHWEEMDPTNRLLAEAHVQTAIALARLLQFLARSPRLLADPAAAAAALAPLTGGCDPAHLGAWRGRWTGASSAPPTRPTLLTAALAAADWMECGITDLPSPLAALAASASLLAEAGTLRTIPLPFWAAVPVLATGEPAGLPRLRSDAASRLFAAGTPTWPGVFFCLMAESARAGLRELDRLQVAAAAGAQLAAGLDVRSRLPAAVECALRSPALTARGLAQVLRITPQAARRLLAELEHAKVVRETTGRGSFRAFAI